jgi:hypothetical protein
MDACLFGVVEDGSESVFASSGLQCVGEDSFGVVVLVLGADGAEAVEIDASCFAHGVGYAEGYVGVLVEVGGDVDARGFY